MQKNTTELRDEIDSSGSADNNGLGPSDVDIGVSNDNTADSDADTVKGKISEVGGPRGPEPTRYGDWEVNGRCSDF